MARLFTFIHQGITMSNKTLFNSDHLPILKKQLHTIFDQLTFAEIIQGNATEKTHGYRFALKR
uniref:Uncharacterized protein n=1 Tax=Vibrio tasmaniensis TaxID=212663 RepID=A0A0H3ZZW1_9VIBR|nr:hypothetical protein [Vibrio tasmaniensis]